MARLGQHRPALAADGPNLTRSRPNLSRIRPALAEIDLIWPDIGQSRPDLARHRSHFARIWSNLARGQILATQEGGIIMILQRRLSNIVCSESAPALLAGACLQKCLHVHPSEFGIFLGRSCAEFAQSWPHSASIAQCGPKLGQSWSTLAADGVQVLQKWRPRAVPARWRVILNTCRGLCRLFRRPHLESLLIKQ